MTERVWHILDAGDIAVREFGSALNAIVPTHCWQPDFTWLPTFGTKVREERLTDPPIHLLRFNLQHGYSRSVIGRLCGFAKRTEEMIADRSGNAADSPLVCTTPFYAPVAQRWKGPVIYYLTDFTSAYENVDPRKVLALDRALCDRSDVVAVNSRRLAKYLIGGGGCDPDKVVIIPNATRKRSLRSAGWSEADQPPGDIADMARPLIGVIGNLAANLDWELLRDAIRANPSLSWVFVGPYSMKMACAKQRTARRDVLATQPQVRFLGMKPYGLLQSYARSFDAAVIPYRKTEPTFSGSSTRFYEHLAACRPIVATRGVEELTRKEPLLTLIDGPEELTRELGRLQARDFRDGREYERWKASRTETWECRARTLVEAVERMERRTRTFVSIGELAT